MQVPTIWAATDDDHAELATPGGRVVLAGREVLRRREHDGHLRGGGRLTVVLVVGLLCGGCAVPGLGAAFRISGHQAAPRGVIVLAAIHSASAFLL